MPQQNETVNEQQLSLTPEQYQQAIQECEEQMAAVATYDGLLIERRGVWVWVTGKTRKHHVALKGAGFKYAPRKEAWFWKPAFVPSVKKGTASSMKYIRDTWAKDSSVFQTEDEEVA